MNIEKLKKRETITNFTFQVSFSLAYGKLIIEEKIKVLTKSVAYLERLISNPSFQVAANVPAGVISHSVGSGWTCENCHGKQKRKKKKLFHDENEKRYNLVIGDTYVYILEVCSLLDDLSLTPKNNIYLIE